MDTTRQLKFTQLLNIRGVLTWCKLITHNSLFIILTATISHELNTLIAPFSVGLPLSFNSIYLLVEAQQINQVFKYHLSYSSLSLSGISVPRLDLFQVLAPLLLSNLQFLFQCLLIPSEPSPGELLVGGCFLLSFGYSRVQSVRSLPQIRDRI